MKQFRAQIISNKKIAEDHYILSFKIPAAAGKITPGQFFNIKVNSLTDPLLRRPFGAHKIKSDRIDILYKIVGKATRILSLKIPGETIDVIGPIGKGFDIRFLPRSRKGKAVLVAGGHGVAPLYALAEKLAQNIPCVKISIFIGARTKRHIVCEQEFKKLGVKVYIATEDGSKGYKGVVPDLLKDKLRIITGTGFSSGSVVSGQGLFHVVYACGPKPMLKEIAGISDKYKCPCQVSLEEYLGCGTGICMGCAVDTRSGKRLICKDGPVFDAGEIIW